MFNFHSKATTDRRCFTVFLAKGVDWQGYLVFDIHQNGKHLDYIVKSLKTGKFHLTYNTALSSEAMEVICQFINDKLDRKKSPSINI
ncbi:hypothetical protein [Rubrolithibacter danxiaensis]|uniref:hypothetical protein n=1 Tax=Rubrolithibacter danxiaensis TaxID=3390805 RepID=UPI003BF83238